MKFICDDNLGRLAAYLRILGFDTLFYEKIDDAALLRLAAGENRCLLTRDNKLAAKSHPYGVLFLKDDNPLNQLSMVIKDLYLIIKTDLLFARCSKCNSLSRSVDKKTLSDSVFPFILKSQSAIYRCPVCGRYYWKGSHYKSLLRKLKSAVRDENISGEWPDVDSGEI